MELPTHLAKCSQLTGSCWLKVSLSSSVDPLCASWAPSMAVAYSIMERCRSPSPPFFSTSPGSHPARLILSEYGLPGESWDGRVPPPGSVADRRGTGVRKFAFFCELSAWPPLPVVLSCERERGRPRLSSTTASSQTSHVWLGKAILSRSVTSTSGVEDGRGSSAGQAPVADSTRAGNDADLLASSTSYRSFASVLSLETKS